MIKISKKKPKTYIGLDLDEKSIKLVELKKSPLGVALVNYAIKEVEGGEEADKTSAVIKTVKKIRSELGLEETEVFSSVSGPGVSIRRIVVPDMPEEELRGAVRWEAKNLIPFPLESVVLDYYVIGKVQDKGVEKLDIIVVAVQEDVLNKQIRILEESGLKPIGITVNSFALWDVVKKEVPFKEGEVIALIDIGAEAASINLFKNNILQFTREISVAGENITKAMTGMLISDQYQLSLTYEQAEKIKLGYGIPKEGTLEKTSDGIPLSQILEIIKPTLRRMLNEILRSFDYYKEQFREAKIDRVFLAGGSSKLKNLEEFLSAGLGIKVEVVNPLQNINIDLKLSKEMEKLREVAPRLTLAIGLALGEAKTLNLVHVKKAAVKLIDFDKILESVRVPSAAIVAGILIILCAAFGYNYYLGRQLKYYNKELESKRTILRDLKVLSERRAIIEKISKEETRVREILSNLGATIPAGISLLELDYINSKRSMNIRGESLNTTLVGIFLKNLEDSPYFSNVVLHETRKGREEEGQTKALFIISFKVD